MEEKKMILKMLEEGKITSEQAEKLLDAIYKNSNENSEYSDDTDAENDRENINGFFSGISNFVKNTVKSAMESVESKSNLIVDFKGPQRSKSDMKKSFRKNLDYDFDILKVEVGESQVSIKKGDEDYPYVKVWVNKEFSEEEFNKEFDVVENNGIVDIRQKIRNSDFSIRLSSKGLVNSGYDYSSILEIYLPDDFSLETLDVSSKLGGIGVHQLNSEKININTNYGGIRVEGVECEDINLHADAGSINLTDVDCENCILSSDLGGIKIQNVDSELIEMTSSAGSLLVNGSDAETIKLKTEAGSVKVFSSNSELINAFSEAGSVSIKGVDTSDINASTSAGTIFIEDLSDNIENIEARTDAGSIKLDLSSVDKETSAKLSSSLGSIRYPDNFKLMNSSNGRKEIYKDGDNFLSLNLSTNFGSIKIY